MSRSEEYTYKCPYCGKEFDITVYSAVNAEQDPDLRDRCASGDIFRHSCPHCHKDFMIQNNLLYEDPQHKFVIWVSANDIGTDLSAFAEPLKKKGYRLRRCATVQEFVEKIAIFEDGVDDIAVELAKYDSFIEFLDSRKGDPKEVTSISYVHTNDGVMKIDIRLGDKGMSFLIPTDGLDQQVGENKDLFAVDDTQFPCINNDWIISLFTKSQGQA